jgi:hypothetical protein
MTRLAPTALTKAVKAAVNRAPCSLLRLAHVAHVPQNTLWRIQNGERQATPAVASAVARVLEQWGTWCQDAARRIRQAQRRSTP